MTPAVRSLLLFAAAWLLVSLGVFLFLADFFTQWDGRAVSIRSADPDQSRWEVLIADDDGTFHEAVWDKAALTNIDLAIDRLALPPKPLPDGLPTTSKERFSLTFTLTPRQGGVRTVSTAGPQPLAIALLCFLVGVPLRNMLVAGSPFSLTRSAGPAAPPLATSGQPSVPTAPPGRAPGARQGPPPPRRRRGNGRR